MSVRLRRRSEGYHASKAAPLAPTAAHDGLGSGRTETGQVKPSAGGLESQRNLAAK